MTKPLMTHFDDWLRRVDTACWDMAGLSVHDLPDNPYRDWFDDGLEPSKAAKRALKESEP
jgi:hypothetical protein